MNVNYILFHKNTVIILNFCTQLFEKSKSKINILKMKPLLYLANSMQKKMCRRHRGRKMPFFKDHLHLIIIVQ